MSSDYACSTGFENCPDFHKARSSQEVTEPPLGPAEGRNNTDRCSLCSRGFTRGSLIPATPTEQVFTPLCGGHRRLELLSSLHETK